MRAAGQSDISASPSRDDVPDGLSTLDLRIVESQSLLLHEQTDSSRVQRLTRSFSKDDVLRDPPIVAPLQTSEFVVLDGANRITALTRRGYRDQLVQVVDYDRAVTLGVWAHLLREAIPLEKPEWTPMSPDEARAGLVSGAIACAVVADAGAYGQLTSPDLESRIIATGGLVARYPVGAAIPRVLPADLGTLRRRYGPVGAVVLFSPLTKADIETIARLPNKLPSGISRHIVEGRALRINLDLSILRRPASRAQKQAHIDQLVRARFDAQGVRYYPESTVVLDES